MLVRDVVSALACVSVFISQFPGECVGNTEPSETLLQGLD